MVSGELTPDIVYQNESVLAFQDINPKAPVHALVIPKQHIETLNELSDSALAGNLFTCAQQVARLQGLSETGYRVVINCGADGGQEVYHLHLHVLGGRQLTWPPG